MSRLKLYTLLWWAVLAGYILAGTALVPFHGDEATQIYMSRDYAALFLEGDWRRLLYSPTPASPTEQELRLLNGTISKNLIGLSWAAQGFSPADLNEQWDWGADWAYNQANGHAPTPELLLAGRWPSALLLAAGVVPVFLLGAAVGGPWTAYLASLYYALHPALLLNGRRAMMEGSVTLFSLLAVLAGVWFLGRIRAGRAWLPAALALGASAGLALASKHTALFTVGAVFAACALWLLLTPGKRRGIVALLLAGVTGVGVFLALNPAWWGDPLQVPGEVLRLRANLLAIQVQVFGGYSGLLDQLAGFSRQVLVAAPQYYEAPGWQAFIGGEIARYEASPWRGVSVGGTAVGGLVFLGMIILGAWVLLRDRQRDPTARWLIGWWALVAAGATLLLTPLEWQRYYLPVYPAAGLLAARGLAHIIRVRLAATRESG